MDKRRVVVISTGVANTASVLAGLRRAGAEPVLTNDPVQVREATHAVLPGVGAFSAAMEILVRNRLDSVVKERIEADEPTMAVCLGLQLLFEESEESPGVRGLGIFPGHAHRFPHNQVRVPHFGWNRVEPEEGCRFLQPGYAYFANSYRISKQPESANVATTPYAGRFVSALERGNLLACQFHPELSGDWGGDLLRRWLAIEPKGAF